MLTLMPSSQLWSVVVVVVVVVVEVWIDDCIGVQLPVREIYLSVTSNPGQLSLAIPPWVGTKSTSKRR